MKIKISKSQWEKMGKSAGWMNWDSMPEMGQHMPCNYCGSLTRMLGTQICDNCWSLRKKIEKNPEIARKILLNVLKGIQE